MVVVCINTALFTKKKKQNKTKTHFLSFLLFVPDNPVRYHGTGNRASRGKAGRRQGGTVLLTINRCHGERATSYLSPSALKTSQQ